MGALQGAGHLIKKRQFMMRVLDDATTSKSAIGQQISDDAVHDLENLSGLQSELMLELEHTTRGGVRHGMKIYVSTVSRLPSSVAAH